MSKQPVILIVDSESTSCERLFDYLDAKDYKVLVAENGAAAVDVVELASPDLVIMNTRLPDIKGIVACKRIRNTEPGKDIPVLFMAEAHETGRAEVFRSGGSACLTKPLIDEELEVVLQTHLRLISLGTEGATASVETSQSQCDKLDTIVDLIAHEMKNPLMCMVGFIDELTQEFTDASVAEDWVEFLRLIQQSTLKLDLILDALVLLKNLAVREFDLDSEALLDDSLSAAVARYTSQDEALEVDYSAQFDARVVQTDPLILEELLYSIIRTLANLCVDAHPKLAFEISSYADGPAAVRVLIRATTRVLSDAELPLLLKPLTGKQRTFVKDTDVVTLSIQRMIEALDIYAEVESDESGVVINLGFAAADVSEEVPNE